MEPRLIQKKELESGISTDQRDEYQKGVHSIPNGLNIKLWILYVYCSVNINVSEYRYELSSLFMSNLALIPRKSCHAPLPKICENIDTTKSTTYVHEKNTPHTYAKPKVTWTSYKIYYDKSISLQYNT